MSFSLEEAEEDFYAQRHKTNARSRKTAKRRETSDKKLSRVGKSRTKSVGYKTQELRRIRAWMKREEEKERIRASRSKQKKTDNDPPKALLRKRRELEKMQRKRPRNKQSYAQWEDHAFATTTAPHESTSPSNSQYHSESSSAVGAVATGDEAENGECSCPDTTSDEASTTVDAADISLEEVAAIFASFVADETAVQLEFRHLGLKALPLQDFPEFKDVSQRIVQLNLGHNSLKKFPVCLCLLVNIEELHLFSNKLCEASFSSEVDMSGMARLNTLSLGCNRFTALPLCFAQLQALSNLDLHSNAIQLMHASKQTTLTVLLSVKHTLKVLNLGFNRLQGEFDSGLCLALERLEKLYLQGNNLESLPSSIKLMKELKVLKVNGNPLVRPPLATAERGIEAIRRFFNSVEAVGFRMVNRRRARALKRLDHSHARNPYSSNKEEDKAAQALNIKILRKKSNESLKLIGDAEVPPAIEHLSLSSDDEQNAPFSTSLPTREFRGLFKPNGPHARRQTCSVSPPPTRSFRAIREEPCELERDVSMGRVSILSDEAPFDMPFTMEEDEGMKDRNDSTTTISDSWNRSFKVIVVGRSGAGKTSMIRTLMEGKCHLMPTDKRTLGIDIHQYITDQEYDTLAFSIWDFAGQEVYHATHQFFLSRHALYILVWDINACSAERIDKDIMFWIYSIQAKFPGAVIQVVASKCEGVSAEEIEERWDNVLSAFEQHEKWRIEELEYRQNFVSMAHEGDAHILLNLQMRPRLLTQVIPVSSGENQGFEELRRKLSELVLETKLFPHMGADAYVPNNWAIVEDVVMQLQASEGRKYIPWDELYTIVVRTGEKFQISISEDELVAALEWLDDMGQVSNSNNEVVFLDPVWVVEVIKQLVDHSDASTKRIRKLFVQREARSMTERQFSAARQRLDSDVTNLRTKGHLSESLLAYVWDSLFHSSPASSAKTKSNSIKSWKEVVIDHLLRVLQQYDICYEISKQPKNRTWLVPCLLTQRFNPRTQWPPQGQQNDNDLSTHGTVQIGRRYSFQRFSPPGLMPRLLHKVCNSHNDSIFVQPVPPKTWTNAIQFGFPNRLFGRKNQFFRLLLHLHELEDEHGRRRWALDVVARGDTRALVRMWHALVLCFEAVDEVLLSYPGVCPKISVVCPCCLQLLGPERQDAHEFNSWELQLWAEGCYMDEEWESIFASNSEELHLSPCLGSIHTVPCDSEIPHECPLVWVSPPPLEVIDAHMKRAERSLKSSSMAFVPVKYRLNVWDLFLDARAIVRVGVYCSKERRFLTSGTGFVVNAELGLIATAGHLFMDPTCPEKRSSDDLMLDLKAYGVGTPTVEDVTAIDRWIVIGTFVNERVPPVWNYVGVGVIHGASYLEREFLDLIMVRIVGKVKVASVLQTDSGKRYHVVPEATRLSEILPLPAQLNLGDSSIVHIGDPVSVVGYPAARGLSICCASGEVNMFQGDSYIKCSAFQHHGSSGSPLISRQGVVVGIMSSGYSPGDLGLYIAINSCTDLFNRAEELVLAADRKDRAFA